MLAEEAVEPTPEVASVDDSAYIRGIAKLAGQLVILLDLKALLSPCQHLEASTHGGAARSSDRKRIREAR